MMQKIVILGSKGMLGQMVKAYFFPKTSELICYDEKFIAESRDGYQSFLKSLDGSIVINCVANINGKSTAIDDLLFVNTILPIVLRKCLAREIVLVQPGTDGVFKGDKGAPYSIADQPDAVDNYGWSKRLAEVALNSRPNTLIPRVSIIGPNLVDSAKGLLSWVLSQKPDTEVKGYTNHLWNGITTLEWCRQVETFLLDHPQFDYTLFQLGTEQHHSKYEMLELINSIFGLKLRLKPSVSSDSVDRRLIPQVVSRSLEDQLKDLKSFNF